MKRNITVLIFVLCLFFVPSCNLNNEENTNSNNINKNLEYIITFETFGGDEIENITTKGSLDLPDNITKQGYIFRGWYLDNNYNTKFNNIEIKKNIKLYAKWDKDIEYSITFIINGKKIDNKLKTYKETSENIILPKVEVDKGYTFENWYNEKEFINKATDINPGSKGNKIFYGKLKLITRNINYILNGGVNNIDNINTFNIENDYFLLNDPLKEDYLFDGWYTDDGVKITEINTSLNKDISIEARWYEEEFSLNYYNINYLLNSNPEIYYKSQLPLSINYIFRDNYLFCGWYDNQDYIGKPIEIISQAGTINDLYAKWISIADSQYEVLSENNKYYLNKYEGNEENIILPYTFNDKPIKNIRSNLFSSQSTVKNVFITNSYEVIGNNAFSDSYIESCIMPNSLIEIGDFAFSNTNISNITVPNSVTDIGESAFAECNQLKKLVLSNRLVKIPERMCDGCILLEEMIIPQYVTDIAHCAFDDCHNLTNLVLNYNVKSIRDYAFMQTSFNQLILPDSLEFIGTGVFSYNENLTSVTIGNKLNNIGNKSFNNCINLETVIFGNEVESLGELAFANCKLKNLIIPSSIKIINDYAFYNNSSLTYVYIYSGVVIMGQCVFSGCANLTEINCEDTEKGLEWDNYWNYHNIEIDTKILPKFAQEITNN